MSKINQIQQALSEMGGGEFQKLADAFLYEKGFGRVNSIGSVIATNKVKAGTPDTLIATPQGMYVFAEHTTQQTGLIGKLKDDLAKCFDESKTGIPVEKIERVIFCFAGKLNPTEEYELAEACQAKGVNLDLFGIDAIAFDVYSKYPALARDFLGVPIDTGQIVSPEQFVSLYSKNKLATRLDLEFHFREDEVGQLLDALEDGRLVVLSGRAGVGKSRLALEACRRFTEKHAEYDVLCVFGRNRDLWEDLQARFTRPGHFLILVDDANRVSRFEYVVNLLLHQREDQGIKVVATVRDYALRKIRSAARPLGGYSEVELKPFSDEEIQELITDEYAITNYHYLEQIANIAKGNPRLAVMAADVASERPLSSIYDVTGLYDNYFSSIREDLSSEGADPANADLLRAAAIVSFFKAVDRTSDEMMSAIAEAFSMTLADFWEAADQLHEMEVLDMHENEVVRMSDQVLGTYIFYLAVFKERVLDFGAFLVHLFPEFRHRLIDSINPVLNAFDSERIIEAMRLHVEQVWAKLEEEEDENGLLHLLDVFWFTKRTDTLLWARDRINALEPESVEVTDIVFEKDSNSVPSPSILSVLRQFAFAEDDEVRMALDLLSRYLAKRPGEAPFILRVIIDDYGFRADSYMRRFEVQRAVMDELWSRAEGGDALFTQVFLVVASNHLGTHFENHGMKDARVLQITRFDLPASPDLIAMRETIWKRLFMLYKREEIRDDVLRIIRRYSTYSLRVTTSEVVRADSVHVLPFLESALDPSSYQHCAVMHDYLDFLEKHEGEVPAGLRDRFRNPKYALAEILLADWDERRELDLSYKDYERYKRDRLADHTASYTFDDYARLFEHCLEIREVLDERRNEYQLQWGVMNALLSLADRNAELFARVLERYLERGDPLRLNGYHLIQKLISQQGSDATLRLLRKPEFPTKRRWLFHVHEVLPADDVDEVLLAHLYDLYGAADRTDLPHGFDYLLKYLHVDPRVIAEVVSKLLEKAEQDSNSAYVLTMLFNPHTEVAERLPELFAENLDLLKRAYLAAEGTQHHGDYKGEVFNRLLDLDLAFITDYIEWKYETAENGWLSSYDDSRDYSFVWRRSDYQAVMDLVVKSIFNPERDRFAYLYPYLKCFFLTGGGDQELEGIERERQDAYLLRLIDERSEDVDFMQYLFGVIARFKPARRRQFVEHFVQRNTDIDAFIRLPLEPSSWTSHGSWVPVLQGRLNYWGSLLQIMNTIDLLPHKQYVERSIRDLRAQIEREKKNDFIGD